MKFNIACPTTGQQKTLAIDDEKILHQFYEKRMAAEVAGEALGDAFAGYVFRISGGNDKQGFPMKQGVLTQTRVRLLLGRGHSCFRERRRGQRKRKSVRGCIVGSDLSVLNLVIVKRGEQEIAGLTDEQVPRRLGPKRASRIRALFGLSKDDDVRKFVVRREIKEGVSKAPKIQRLITPNRLRRKRAEKAAKKARQAKAKADAADYHKLLKQRYNEAKTKRESLLSKRREQRKSVESRK